jgi:hypothetical protein
MDVTIVIGWDEIVAIDVLSKLRVIDTEEDTDVQEFVCSDEGIEHINIALEKLNNSRETMLKWVRYPGDHFVLVWRVELQKTIGDASDAPTGKFYINTSLGDRLARLQNEFDFKEDPYSICLIDAENYYQYHVYDHDHDDHDDHDDEDLSDDEEWFTEGGIMHKEFKREIAWSGLPPPGWYITGTHAPPPSSPQPSVEEKKEEKKEKEEKVD